MVQELNYSLIEHVVSEMRYADPAYPVRARMIRFPKTESSPEETYFALEQIEDGSAGNLCFWRLDNPDAQPHTPITH